MFYFFGGFGNPSAVSDFMEATTRLWNGSLGAFSDTNGPAKIREHIGLIERVNTKLETIAESGSSNDLLAVMRGEDLRQYLELFSLHMKGPRPDHRLCAPRLLTSAIARELERIPNDEAGAFIRDLGAEPAFTDCLDIMKEHELGLLLIKMGHCAAEIPDNDQKLAFFHACTENGLLERLLPTGTGGAVAALMEGVFTGGDLHEVSDLLSESGVLSNVRWTDMHDSWCCNTTHGDCDLQLGYLVKAVCQGADDPVAQAKAWLGEGALVCPLYVDGHSAPEAA
ncbi:MAG: hypothetical protein ACLFP8_08295 [Alphaproteobacteria bacterium]